MRKLSSVVMALVAVCLIATQCHAFVFTAVPGEKKCFTEELLGFTRYQLEYRLARSLAPFVSTGMIGPNKIVVLENHGFPRDQLVEIVQTHDAGTYSVCFNVHAKANTASSLDIYYTIATERDVQVNAERESERAKTLPTAHHHAAMVQAAYIEQALEWVHGRYRYLKEREADMRETNESTCTRTWGFTIVMILVVVVTSLLRYYKLKFFMIKKKMLD